MALSIQSNASGSWLDITTLNLSNTATIQLGINNPDAGAYDVLLWAAGVSNQSAANVENRQGKEAITEGWLECKLADDSVWVPLRFPASFPDTFAGLAAVDGVFSLTAGASARTLVDFRMVHPEEPVSVGEVKYQLVMRYLSA